ncbi:MAG: fibronectin-binding autotransporter adhesin [Humisphaera sp.]|nr:fibronectin-binding autotransporter adhesin [Humisphaera sp.]
MRKNRQAVLAAAAIATLFGSAALAATSTWDADGPGANTGGSGAWDTTSPLWTQDGGATYVPWSNTNPDSAVFGPTPGTITLAEPITVGAMTFNSGSDGYVIDLQGFNLTHTGGVTFFAPPFPAEIPPAVVPASIVITGTSTATYSVASPVNPGPTLAGGMNVNVTGTTAWAPAAAHSFTGVLTLTGSGTVLATKSSNLGSAAGLVSVQGTKNLQLGAAGMTETFTRNIEMGTGGLGVSGGRFAVVTGTISGGPWKTFNTQGALVLAGNNTFTGKITNSSGGNAIVAASAGALGVANADPLQNVVDFGSTASTFGFLGGIDLPGTRSITGTQTFRPDGAGNYHNFGGNNTFAGGISMGNQTALTVEPDSELLLKGILSGSRSLHKRGEGTLVLANAMTYGNTGNGDFRRMTRVADGTVRFVFSQPTSPLNDIVNQPTARSANDNTISLNGGTLEFKGKADVNNSQYFGNAMRVDIGASAMKIVNAANNNVNVRISSTAITRAVGGTVDFTLASGAQAANLNGYTTSKVNTNGILGGYATADKAAWAATGNAAGTYAINPYVHSAGEQDVAAFDTAANNVDVNATNNLPAADRTVNSLRFNASTTLTLGGTNNVITSGGILVTSNVGSAGATITGGSIKSAAAVGPAVTTDLIVHQHNTAGALTIASTISDSTAATSTTTLTKVGRGTLTLSGTNDYTGATYVNAGFLKLDSAGALPTASKLVLNGGVVGLSSDMTTRAIGDTANTVQWLGHGGFAAYGATRVVNIGSSAALTWNMTGSAAWDNGGVSTAIATQGLYKPGQFVGTGYKLIFGASDADGTIDFQNNINLTGGANIPLPRTIEVIDGTAAVEAKLSGIVSGQLGGLIKTGGGTLELSNANTYTGATIIKGGTLIVSGAIAGTGGGTSVDINPGATLQIGNGGASGTVNGIVADNGAMVFNRTDSVTYAGPIAGTGSVSNAGAGATTLSAVNTYTGATSATAGKLVLGKSLTTSSSVAASGTGVVELSSDGTAMKVINTGPISITGSGKIDIADNKLFTTTAAGNADINGVYSGVQGEVQRALNGGTWDGGGLTTSMPDAATGLTSIGVATGEQVRGLGPTDTDLFAGQTINGATTIAMYTYAGDANLDGFISGDDYSTIDFNAGTGADGWVNGDFNYDGIVSGDDYSTIDFNYAAQGAPFPTSGSVGGLAGVTAVPEPASLSVIGLAAASLLGRRRRR